jgi:hypothetical protein
MKSKKLKKVYQRPEVKSEKERPEANFNCPTTNVKYCSYAYSPKKG